jgi:ribosomal protein S18 acetylase RimI-like enzyme
MTAQSDVQPDAPVWPPGFAVRSYDEIGDLAILAEGSNLCYTNMWGHRENLVYASADRFQQHIANRPNDYPPDGILVVFDAEQKLAGICFNRLEGDEKKKVIDSPGAVPGYRHLGLQRPLVQASMRWLDQQTPGDYHLYTWGDSEEAVRIYRALGFTLRDEDHFIEYAQVGF